MKSLISASLVAATTILMQATPAGATTLQVPSAYSDIQAALNAANNGDVVLVGPGTYTQNLNFGGKQVAVRSTNGPASTIIHVSGGAAVQIGGAAEISGFTITGAAADSGVAVSGVGTLIKGNIFDGNAGSVGGLGAAIGGNVASPIIDGNIFRNNTADTQYLSGVISFINGSSPVITNNLFINNPTRAINFVLPSGNAPVVANNTFVNNSVAIKYGSFSTTTFTNNILFGNSIGLLQDYPGYAPIWSNNDVFGNTTNYSGYPDFTGTDGNISADPLFVSSTNFHLLSNSPAIDAGTLLDAPNHDFDNYARPFGAAPDMGAYEVPEPAMLAPIALTALLLRRRQANRSQS